MFTTLPEVNAALEAADKEFVRLLGWREQLAEDTSRQILLRLRAITRLRVELERLSETFDQET